MAFPLPQGFDAAKTQLYHVSPEGEKELLTAKTADGLLNAELTHLSLYVLAQPKAGAEKRRLLFFRSFGRDEQFFCRHIFLFRYAFRRRGGRVFRYGRTCAGNAPDRGCVPAGLGHRSRSACVVLLAVLAWKRTGRHAHKKCDILVKAGCIPAAVCYNGFKPAACAAVCRA